MEWYQKSFYITVGILIGIVSAFSIGLIAEFVLPK